MRYAAFLRNVNLGQPRSPTREQLERAFLQAGASSASSFMSNGTVVFEMEDGRLAQRTADGACEILSRVCGMQQPAFARSMRHLSRLVSENPFTASELPTSGVGMLTLFKPVRQMVVKAPLVTRRNDCLIFRIDKGEAFSITRPVDGQGGSPSGLLEKLLGRPVTTRNWTTILRLVNKHG